MLHVSWVSFYGLWWCTAHALQFHTLYCFRDDHCDKIAFLNPWLTHVYEHMLQCHTNFISIYYPKLTIVWRPVFVSLRQIMWWQDGIFSHLQKVPLWYCFFLSTDGYLFAWAPSTVYCPFYIVSVCAYMHSPTTQHCFCMWVSRHNIFQVHDAHFFCIGLVSWDHSI